MPQLLLPGFPDGASVSVLKKEGRVTYFVGGDNYFSHQVDDKAGLQLAITTLIANRHVRAGEVEKSCLGIPHRTLMHWLRQSEERGPGFFYAPRAVRGGTVITPEKKALECGRLLDAGHRLAEVARLAGINESALRKAAKSKRILRHSDKAAEVSRPSPGEAKSDRSRLDAVAATGLGTACTRVEERMAAAFGLIGGAVTRFEACKDVVMGNCMNESRLYLPQHLGTEPLMLPTSARTLLVAKSKGCKVNVFNQGINEGGGIAKASIILCRMSLACLSFLCG